MQLVASNKIHYEETLAAFQPFYDKKLTKSDAIEIQSNLRSLSELLSSWGKNE